MMKRSGTQLQRAYVSFLLLVLLATASQGQGAGASASYRIGPKDLVSVEVLEDDSLNAEIRVTETGAIELAHVGPVSVSGLTTSEAADVLAEALEKYLQKATVTLRVTEFRSQPITLIGAFRSPGTLPFSGRWTLVDALTQTGGLTDAAGTKILVLRRASNGLSDQLVIDRRELLERGNPDINITLFPNDLINVPVASNVTILIMGEVSTPGAVAFKSGDRITLLSVLARAGGLTERASNNVIVRRADSDKEVRVNYKKLLAGGQPDIALSDGDLVIVKESFF